MFLPSGSQNPYAVVDALPDGLVDAVVVLHLLFGRDAVVDVGPGSYPANEATGVIEERRCPCRAPPVLTVMSADAHGGRELLAGLGGATPRGGRAGDVVGVDGRRPPLAAQDLAPQPGELLQPRVVVDVPAVGPGDPHHVRDGLDDVLEPDGRRGRRVWEFARHQQSLAVDAGHPSAPTGPAPVGFGPTA